MNKFRANFETKMRNAKIHFDPPKLLNIDFYNKQFSDAKPEGALNITFQLPKGLYELFRLIVNVSILCKHYRNREPINESSRTLDLTIAAEHEGSCDIFF